MTADLVIQILSGINRGMVLFVTASGLTLIFGVLRVVNFAHGAFYMLAAYLTYSVMKYSGGTDAGFLAALIVVPLCLAALGAVIERVLLRQILSRDHLYQLALTFALTLIISDLVKGFWGGDNLSVSRPPLLDGSIHILGRLFPVYYVAVVSIGLATVIVLSFVIARTRFGLVIRAAVIDPETVGALGADVPQLHMIVFALGIWLAGLGGALAAPLGSVSLGMDSSIIIESFAVVLIGGSGSIAGAFVGSLILGITQSLGILVAPRLGVVFIFLVLIAVLLTRPQGLMGRRV